MEDAASLIKQEKQWENKKYKTIFQKWQKQRGAKKQEFNNCFLVYTEHDWHL